MSARVEGNSQISPLNGNTEQTASQKDVQNNGRAIKYHPKISGGKQFGYILAAVFSFGLALISKGCRQGCNGYKVSKFEMSETNLETKNKLENMKISELKQLAVAVFKKESKQNPAFQAPSLKNIGYEILVNTLTITLQHIRERNAEEGESFEDAYSELSRNVRAGEPVEESEEDHSIGEEDVDSDIDGVEDNGPPSEEEFKALLKEAALKALKKLKIAPKDVEKKFKNNKKLYMRFLNEVRKGLPILPRGLAEKPVEKWEKNDVAGMEGFLRTMDLTK